MRLLITGGCGFIGSNLIGEIIDRPSIELLVNLDCLTYAGSLKRVARFSNHRKYQFERVDLREGPEVHRVVDSHRITHVMHLAAETHVDRSILDPEGFVRTNVNGTFHLLEACRICWNSDLQNKRFLHVSTDEVFGSLGPAGLFTETSAYSPNSPYSASKASSDFLAFAFGQTYDLPVLVTHCSNNYGPFQHPEKLIPRTIHCALGGSTIPVYGDGLHIRDWLHVRDHARALWQLLEGRSSKGRYNIGARNEQSNLAVVGLICDLVDELTARPSGTSRKLITLVKDRLGHDRRYAVDPSRIEQEFKWQPRYLFQEGMRETVRWYIDHSDWIQEVLATSASTAL